MVPPAPLPGAGGADPVASLLIALVAIFVSTKLLGELAQRIGQPAVLGELLAGVLLGGSVLGIVDPSNAVLAAMAQIGVLVLLFETGLHTELQSLLNVGKSATTVALAGVVIPFALGYASALAFGFGHIPALVGGAALCATSIGISARVLSDLGRLETLEGRVVLGAAVLDEGLCRRIVNPLAGVFDIEHIVPEPVEAQRILEVIPEGTSKRIGCGQAGDGDAKGVGHRD